MYRIFRYTAPILVLAATSIMCPQVALAIHGGSKISLTGSGSPEKWECNIPPNAGTQVFTRSAPTDPNSSGTLAEAGSGICAVFDANGNLVDSFLGTLTLTLETVSGTCTDTSTDTASSRLDVSMFCDGTNSIVGTVIVNNPAAHPAICGDGNGGTYDPCSITIDGTDTANCNQVFKQTKSAPFWKKAEVVRGTAVITGATDCGVTSSAGVQTDDQTLYQRFVTAGFNFNTATATSDFTHPGGGTAVGYTEIDKADVDPAVIQPNCVNQIIHLDICGQPNLDLNSIEMAYLQGQPEIPGTATISSTSATQCPYLIARRSSFDRCTGVIEAIRNGATSLEVTCDTVQGGHCIGEAPVTSSQ